MQPQFEVADVLQKVGSKIESYGLNTWQLRTLFAIKKCRTAELGGHIDACDGCGNLSISYNSCRNRHCPKCQGKNREDWIQARETELLPVPYFHVVFTLPDSINALAIHSPKLVYDTLFEATWETLQQFGKAKEMQMGMIAVLHTWGQQLSLHPHLHCIVPGGGVNKDAQWKNSRTDGKFLFPVKALSKVFRAKYCAKLKAKEPIQYEQIRQDLWKKSWVVFAKKPFGSPKSVVEYLGRYTHKIAISNHRIKSIDEQNVTFEYKDYRMAGVKKLMTLTHQEFIRRFSLHILPKRFVKIRHYGFLSSTWKRVKLKLLQEKLQVKVIERAEKKPFLPKCPCCKTGNLHRIAVFDQRGPPAWYLGGSQNSISCES
ncbi:IS91 family transposase [Flavobacterium soyangense]|uniref:IS91 family transposase n=1 Tax=Flavobacterium soyangense TaxID=2023265 RepID=A0A930UER4_9FLAO|nr:IS91 family transposase [Flavobacterium soyangense]MBF2710064.1 IS91 family transposase [Flavobacterium soyangense]